MGYEETVHFLENFAIKHNIELITNGTVGFGDSCVGFVKGKQYIAHNPISYRTYDTIEGLENKDLYAPDEVNAYSKMSCLCVLVDEENYEKALEELRIWIEAIARLGEVKIVAFDNEATGTQALFTGTTGYAITI